MIVFLAKPAFFDRTHRKIKLVKSVQNNIVVISFCLSLFLESTKYKDNTRLFGQKGRKDH